MVRIRSSTNLVRTGARFEHVVMEPRKSEDLWKLTLIDRELFAKCSSNVGLYNIVKDALERGCLAQNEVDEHVGRVLGRWKRDFCLPFPLATHPSWLVLELFEAKQRLASGLEQQLLLLYHGVERVEKVPEIMTIVTREIAGFDTIQLFDITMTNWVGLLTHESLHRKCLSVSDARVVGKALRRIIGNPVGTFSNAVVNTSLTKDLRPKLVWLPLVGLVPKMLADQLRAARHRPSKNSQTDAEECQDTARAREMV